MNQPVTQEVCCDDVLAKPGMGDLKRKSVIGGFAAVSAQAVKFVVQTATTMILARLLSPQDFGLQGMVVVVTGFLGLFRDAGLGMATIQRSEVTHEQVSTLFWINLAVGALLATACAALAPVLVSFYHEPRLYWVAVVSGVTFLFNGLAARGPDHAKRFTTGIRIAGRELGTGEGASKKQSEQAAARVALNLIEQESR